MEEKEAEIQNMTKKKEIKASTKKAQAEDMSEFAPYKEVIPQDDNKSEHSDTGSESSSQKSSSFSRTMAPSVMTVEDKQKMMPKQEFMKKLNNKEDFFGIRLFFLIFPASAIALIVVSLLVTSSVSNLQHITGMHTRSKLVTVPYLILGLIRCNDIITNNDMSKSTSVLKTCSTSYSTLYKKYSDGIFTGLKEIYTSDLKDSYLRKLWTTPSFTEKIPMLRSPIENSLEFGKRATLFDIGKTWMTHAMTYFLQMENEVSTETHFLYMWKVFFFLSLFFKTSKYLKSAFIIFDILEHKYFHNCCVQHYHSGWRVYVQ